MDKAMYACTRFHSIWRTSDLGTKFAQKNTLGLSVWTNACSLRITYFKQKIL